MLPYPPCRRPCPPEHTATLPPAVPATRLPLPCPGRCDCPDQARLTRLPDQLRPLADDPAPTMPTTLPFSCHLTSRCTRPTACQPTTLPGPCSTPTSPTHPVPRSTLQAASRPALAHMPIHHMLDLADMSTPHITFPRCPAHADVPILAWPHRQPDLRRSVVPPALPAACRRPNPSLVDVSALRIAPDNPLRLQRCPRHARRRPGSVPPTRLPGHCPNHADMPQPIRLRRHVLPPPSDLPAPPAPRLPDCPALNRDKLTRPNSQPPHPTDPPVPELCHLTSRPVPGGLHGATRDTPRDRQPRPPRSGSH